jgi:hypothetical protein
MFVAILIMVLSCLILLCLLPLVRQSIWTLIEAIVEWKMATQLYKVTKVNPIPENKRDDAF